MFNHIANTKPGNPGISPEDRERLELAFHAARVRCGLANTPEPSNPITFASRFAAMLRRLGVSR